MNFILASASPRRKQILEDAGFTFNVIPSLTIEPPFWGDDVYKYVEFLANLKAFDVFKKHGGVVLGADTVVWFNGKIFGKHKNKEDAIKTLKLLSGNTHEVITGYNVISRNLNFLSHEVTKVTFNLLSYEDILSYVESGLPLGKAGSYGIQDGYNLVKSIEGSYSNVVGLPIEKISKILREIK